MEWDTPQMTDRLSMGCTWIAMEYAWILSWILLDDPWFGYRIIGFLHSSFRIVGQVCQHRRLMKMLKLQPWHYQGEPCASAVQQMSRIVNMFAIWLFAVAVVSVLCFLVFN